MNTLRVALVGIVLEMALGIGVAYAYYLDTGTIEFTQPNGTTFTGRQWGDNFSRNSVTEDGYRFIENSDDRYFYFAKHDSGGDFRATRFKVGIDDPTAYGIRKNLNRSLERQEEIAKARDEFWGQTPAGAGKALSEPASPITIAIILVEFDDVKHRTDANGDDEYTESNYDSMYFNQNGYVHPDGESTYGSINKYYEDMSDDELSIIEGSTGGVLNQTDANGNLIWLTLPEDKSWYHVRSISNFHSACLTAAQNAGFNVTTGNTRKLAFIYAGNLYDTNGSVSSGLTPAANWAPGVRYTTSELRDTNPSTNVRNQETPNAVFAHIGTAVHEIGHLIGLHHPNDVPTGPNVNDVGWWSPMQSGNQNGPRIGSCPISLTPEELVWLEWASYTDITGRRDELSISAGTYYRIPYISPGYFVIEHRNGGSGFNRYLYSTYWNGSGLLLWYMYNSQTANGGRFQDLVEADGTWGSVGMAGDVFPGTGSVVHINDDTNPEPSDATGINSGTNTHFALANIDNNGTSTTVDVFDNHYSDTPTVITMETAEARKQRVNLTWDNHASNPTHYVHWGTASNTYPNLVTVPSNEFDHLLSSLTNDTWYYFKVNSSTEFANIAHACRSDFDGDQGTIDYDDFFLFAYEFGNPVNSYARQRFDLSGNGSIDTASSPTRTGSWSRSCSRSTGAPSRSPGG